MCVENIAGRWTSGIGEKGEGALAEGVALTMGQVRVRGRWLMRK